MFSICESAYLFVLSQQVFTAQRWSTPLPSKGLPHDKQVNLLMKELKPHLRTTEGWSWGCFYSLQLHRRFREPSAEVAFAIMEREDCNISDPGSCDRLFFIPEKSYSMGSLVGCSVERLPEGMQVEGQTVNVISRVILPFEQTNTVKWVEAMYEEIHVRLGSAHIFSFKLRWHYMHDTKDLFAVVSDQQHVASLKPRPPPRRKKRKADGPLDESADGAGDDGADGGPDERDGGTEDPTGRHDEPEGALEEICGDGSDGEFDWDLIDALGCISMLSATLLGPQLGFVAVNKSLQQQINLVGNN